MRRVPVRAPTLEHLFIGALVLWGVRLGAQPISDNSMFVHLRTGIRIVETGAIPRVDPYSWTARGEDWTVQSWLAEWTYGWLHRIGGFELVVIEQAVLMGGLALVVGLLARAGSARRSALAGVLAVAVGSPFWVPRPLLFGLLGLALTVYVVERGRSPWWLVPVVWIWVQTHGSFVLGLGWLALRVGGEAAEDRRRPLPSWRHLATFVVGLGVAVLNPLGWRLLAFPYTAWEKRDVFRTLVEWRPPEVGRMDTTIAFVALGVAGGLLVQAWLRGAQTPWRQVLPAVAFVAAGLMAMRNLPMAGVVLAPVLADALKTADPQPVAASRIVDRMLAGVLVAAGLLFLASAGSGPAIGPKPARHPVAAGEYLQGSGLLDAPHRLANDEVAGGWLILRYGDDAGVFVDDRFDMYPEEISEDLDLLLAGRDPALKVLDRHDVNVVLWRRSRSLADLLFRQDAWRAVHEDEYFVVFVRNRIISG